MPPSLQRLAELLQKLPGIGPKTAQRLAYFILTLPRRYCSDLASVLLDVAEKIRHCESCFNYTEESQCDICQDARRRQDLICVVEHPKNIRVIENTGYPGRYHVLGGVISPLEGVGPEELRLAELLSRIESEKITEVIFAFSPRVEADTTVDYIREIIIKKNPEIKLSRPASGIPMGCDLEYADAMTLHQAFYNRRIVKGY
jgi:recombination protein RecR